MTAPPYAQSGAITIYHGNALSILPQLPEAVADCLITSPPYFAQREYGNSIHEIGREPTPNDYLGNLLLFMARALPTLTKDANIFINLGDKYNADGPVKRASTAAGYPRARRQPRWPGMSLKSLMLLPQRFAIGCVDDLHLALRGDIIWNKGEGGADGKATDRVRRSHEHIYHFTRALRHGESIPAFQSPGPSVWTLPPATTGSRNGRHPATFPVTLPERLLLTWTRPGATVLDPFAGSGATMDAAIRHHRGAILIDLEERFCEQMATRLVHSTKGV